MSVVIPTYNRRDVLPPLVERVLAQDPHEVVVVVDGNVDGSAELLAELARGAPRLRPVERANGGIAAARQTGLEAATGQVVLFLDDDVVPHPGLVEGHARHHERAHGLVVVGYMPNDPDALSDVERAIASLYAKSYEATVDFYERHPDRILHRLWGGNFSIERDVGRRVGMVSRIAESRGHEDREFGLRCVRAGLSARFDRTLRVEHRYRRSLPGFRTDRQRSGAYGVQLHAAYPDIVEQEVAADPQSDDRPGPNLPSGLRRLLPLAAREPLHRVLVGTLEAALRLPLVRRSSTGTLTVVRGIGTLETQRGVLEATSAREPEDDGRSRSSVRRFVGRQLSG
jgi:glycosyltransferase involved in cell wall biosynthesis